MISNCYIPVTSYTLYHFTNTTSWSGDNCPHKRKHAEKLLTKICAANEVTSPEFKSSLYGSKPIVNFLFYHTTFFFLDSVSKVFLYVEDT